VNSSHSRLAEEIHLTRQWVTMPRRTGPQKWNKRWCWRHQKSV